MKCSAVAVTIYGKWMPSCQVEQRIMQTLHRHYMSHKCILNELDLFPQIGLGFRVKRATLILWTAGSNWHWRRKQTNNKTVSSKDKIIWATMTWHKPIPQSFFCFVFLVKSASHNRNDVYIPAAKCPLVINLFGKSLSSSSSSSSQERVFNTAVQTL